MDISQMNNLDTNMSIRSLLVCSLNRVVYIKSLNDQQAQVIQIRVAVLLFSQLETIIAAKQSTHRLTARRSKRPKDVNTPNSPTFHQKTGHKTQPFPKLCFCHLLPCPKVFLPAGKNMVKSPVITPMAKTLTTLIAARTFLSIIFCGN